jgi:hypothetical protein
MDKATDLREDDESDRMVGAIIEATDGDVRTAVLALVRRQQLRTDGAAGENLRPATVRTNPATNSADESDGDPIDAKLGGWRGATLARARGLARQADPRIRAAIKWRKPTNPADAPVWSRYGVGCAGETCRDKGKLTFAKGAELEDPARLFNSGLDGSLRRAIEPREGDGLDAVAFRNLVRAAVALNASGKAIRRLRERTPARRRSRR